MFLFTVTFYTNAFTNRRFYPQTFLHIRNFYTQDPFTHKRFFYTDAFIHRHFSTQTLSTHKNFLIQKKLNTDGFYTYTFICKHFYTQEITIAFLREFLATEFRTKGVTCHTVSLVLPFLRLQKKIEKKERARKQKDKKKNIKMQEYKDVSIRRYKDKQI